MAHANEARLAYRFKCTQCKREFTDQKTDNVYVVATDQYWCSPKCWDAWRSAQNGQSED